METTKDAPGRELHDHENISGTTIHGWPSVGFGMIFVAAGTAVSFVIVSDSSADTTASFLSVIFGGLFIIGGLSFVVNGLAGVRRRGRARLGRGRHPDEPWRWDHPWEEKGARDDTVRRLLLWTYRTLFIAVFLLPFNWLVFFSGELPWWGLVGFGFGAGILDLLVVYMVYRFGRSLVQLLRYGVGGIRYARFPFFLGESLDATLRPRREMPAGGLTATLRCVAERYESRGHSSDPSPTVVSYEVYLDKKPVEVAVGTVGRVLGVDLSFPLPTEMPPTSLSERPPVYWEIEVQAEAPGADYEATFLVPVYARHGGDLDR